MDFGDMEKVLKSAIDNNYICCIEIGEELIYGIIVSFSREIVLLYNLVDFIFDGYIVINTLHISNICVGKSDLFCSKIMRKENKMPKRNLLTDLGTDNFEDAFKILMKKEKCVSVYINGREDFVLGEIKEVTFEYAVLKLIDAAGEWCNELEKVYYRNIEKLLFADSYTVLMYKYAHN